ncbi:MAG: Tox-REase-5 domain-containing protein [Chloroflexota bacterium]
MSSLVKIRATTTNRFLTPDTIVPDPTNPQTLNRYSYVNNRPINLWDPSGHNGCNFGYLDCAIAPHSEGEKAFAAFVVSFTPGVGFGMDVYDINNARMEQRYGAMTAGIVFMALPGATRQWKYVGKAAIDLIPLQRLDNAGNLIGQWTKANHGMSDGARRYQEFVTGMKADEGLLEFNYNGINFDGAVMKGDDLVLLDAKLWGTGKGTLYEKMQYEGESYNNVINRARKQVTAAGGVQVEWHFSNKEVADYMKSVLRNEEITEDMIKVVYTKWE